MRKSLLVLVLGLMAFTAMTAAADLQNVQIGGELRIRYNHIVNNYAVNPPVEQRWAPNFLNGRSIGDPILYSLFGAGLPALLNNNGVGILSPYSWDDKSNNMNFTEQRTRLNFKADFTSEVSAFVEFDSYDQWGEEFRSNWITGADARQNDANDDVSVYQAFIEADNMWGTPLKLRVGRQELIFGSEWLVGNKDYGPYFPGRSFDALRLTWAGDAYTVDAWAANLLENGNAEQDGDVWFYGLYGSCTAVEDWTFDAYWLWLRDASSVNDTNLVWYAEWFEDVIGIDDYDPSNLHTLGLRANGVYGGFDFNAEAAYQFGNADSVGFLFRPYSYGDDSADFNAWACTLEAGYTFDCAWSPRVGLFFDYYYGEDNRDITFWEWVNPFDKPEASVSFNRLFSDKMFNGYFDLNNDMSNFWATGINAKAMPTEQVVLMADVMYFEAVDAFDAPRHFQAGRYIVPIAPALSWWTQSNDKALAWQGDLVAIYNYSADLSFFFHYCYLHTLDGLADGAFSGWNGLLSTQGSDDDDGHYIALETTIKF